MRALKRWLPRILLGLVATGGGVAVWRYRAAPLEVRAYAVERGGVVREVFGTGLLESVNMVDLGFDLPGRITALSVDEGDTIEVGQVLGEIDGSELEGQLGVADANRALAELSAARAKADIERTLALRDRARADLDRAERLVGVGAMAASERDALATRVSTAEADYRAALAARAQLSQSVTVAKKSRGVTETLASRSRLRSPIAGFVVRRPRSVGDFAQVGLPVFRVADRQLRVRAWVDESRLAELTQGQMARVILRSEPDASYAGKVTRVAREADRQTHEVLVDVELTRAPERFAIGQRADVFIETAARADVVRVPMEFCTPTDKQCLIEREGRAALKAIEPGLIGSSFFEVRDGLSAGDRVVAPAQPGEAIPLDRRLRVARSP
jgi:HlyD family secretion protein